jgi:hypothetical protein
VLGAGADGGGDAGAGLVVARCDEVALGAAEEVAAAHTVTGDGHRDTA